MNHVDRISIQGNPNIGMYVFATDKFAIAGTGVTDAEKEKLEAVLKVPVHILNICGTSLTGLFLTGDENVIFVPAIAFPREIAELRKICPKVIVLDTLCTALANTFIYKEGVIIANKAFEDKLMAQIKKELDVKAYRMEVADTDVVGATIVFTKKGAMAHPEIAHKDLDILEKELGLKITLGTVNWGSPYVKAGIVCNSNGFLIGETSSGPEVTNADEALGFTNDN